MTVLGGGVMGVTGAELSDIPMEELQRIRHKIGTKKFDSALRGSLQERETRSFKRANKNRLCTCLSVLAMWSMFFFF